MAGRLSSNRNRTGSTLAVPSGQSSTIGLERSWTRTTSGARAAGCICEQDQGSVPDSSCDRNRGLDCSPQETAIVRGRSIPLPIKDKQPGIRGECGLFVPKQETRLFGRMFSGGAIDQGLKTTNPIVVLNSEVVEQRRGQLVFLCSAIPLCGLCDLCGEINRSPCRDHSEG